MAQLKIERGILIGQSPNGLVSYIIITRTNRDKERKKRMILSKRDLEVE